MSDVRISVLSDPESTRGGEAIIRIVGVGLVPPGSTYRIDPIDDEGAGEPPEGWPSGELRPRGLRITKDGVDIVVGPDVVESPALLPGTPVIVSVPSVAAKSELRWPSLPMSKAPRRGAIVMSAQQRSIELAARAEAERVAAAKARAEAEQQEVDRQRAQKILAEKAAEAEAEARIRRIAEAAAATTAPESERPGPATAAAEPLSRLQPVVRPQSSDGVGLAPPVPPKPAPLKPAPLMPAASSALPSPPGVRAVTAAPTPARPPPPSRLTAAVAPFAAGCIVAGAVAAGLWATQVRQTGASKSAPAAILATADRTGAFAAPGLAAILDVPARSPAGQSAEGVDLAEALQRADNSLHATTGGQPRQEAKFWLRKALSLGLGDERLLWAMTQLGTLYANPDGEAPDYASARVLWELAAAKGDPVAQCFLASLLDRGLGAPRDAKRALELYERARTGGSCRGAAEAISRLKKDAP